MKRPQPPLRSAHPYDQPGRLAYYRAYADWYNWAIIGTQPPNYKHSTWRDHWKHLRATASPPPHYFNWNADRTKLFTATLPWRHTGTAVECSDSRQMPTGYYADNFQDETVKGCVVQLPTRKGTPCYVPVTYHTEYDGYTLHWADRCHTKEQAGRYADRCAELEADEYREADAKDQAEQQIEGCKHEVVEARAALRQMLWDTHALRKQPDTPASRCAALRREVATFKHTINAARKRIAVLTDDYWAAVT